MAANVVALRPVRARRHFSRVVGSHVAHQLVELLESPRCNDFERWTAVLQAGVRPAEARLALAQLGYLPAWAVPVGGLESA